MYMYIDSEIKNTNFLYMRARSIKMHLTLKFTHLS